MGLRDILRRMAALEPRPTKFARLCIAFATPPGCEFFGFRATPFYLVDCRTEHLAPGDFFEVHGTDREQCVERATAMAYDFWLDHPTLVVVLRPITKPHPPRYHDEKSR